MQRQKITYKKANVLEIRNWLDNKLNQLVKKEIEYIPLYEEYILTQQEWFRILSSLGYRSYYYKDENIFVEERYIAPYENFKIKLFEDVCFGDMYIELID